MACCVYLGHDLFDLDSRAWFLGPACGFFAWDYMFCFSYVAHSEFPLNTLTIANEPSIGLFTSLGHVVLY